MGPTYDRELPPEIRLLIAAQAFLVDPSITGRVADRLNESSERPGDIPEIITLRTAVEAVLAARTDAALADLGMAIKAVCHALTPPPPVARPRQSAPTRKIRSGRGSSYAAHTVRDAEFLEDFDG